MWLTVYNGYCKQSAWYVEQQHRQMEQPVGVAVEVEMVAEPGFIALGNIGKIVGMLGGRGLDGTDNG
jgi:hypothetical protein